MGGSSVHGVDLRAGAIALAFAALGCSSTDNSARKDATVGAMVTSTCSTTSVEGLSLQIVAQANCINPGAYVALPKLDNVSFGSSGFAFMELPARDAWAAAAASNKAATMTVNSVLRTVAQQYLLHRWYQAGTCGVSLAATPGTSNHESGIAFDVEEYTAWMPALKAHGFEWFGASDAVHFDYKGPGSVDYRGTDVKAFQVLWNLNNPADPITADGDYGAQTEARLKQAPASGFPIGATCAAPAPDKSFAPAPGR